MLSCIGYVSIDCFDFSPSRLLGLDDAFKGLLHILGQLAASSVSATATIFHSEELFPFLGQVNDIDQGRSRRRREEVSQVVHELIGQVLNRLHITHNGRDVLKE